MSLTAVLTNNSKQLQITRTLEGTVYRTDLYPTESVSMRYWTENAHSYVALLVNLQEVIKISSDASDLDFGNTILGIADPLQAYNNAKLALETNLTGGGGGGGVASSVTISSLPGSVAADIAAIKLNTEKLSQYQFQLVVDSANVTFVARYNTLTGAVANLGLNGLPYSPTGSIGISNNNNILALEINEFEALTNQVEWVVGDILTRVLIINTSSGEVTGVIWQGADGQLLQNAPSLGTDVRDTDTQALDALRSIDTKLEDLALTTSIISTNTAASVGTPVTGEALPSGSGPLGWLSNIYRKLKVGLVDTVDGIGVTLSRKQSITGFITTAVTNANLLDATGAGGWTDVRGYSSCELTFVVAAATGLSGIIQTALDSVGTGISTAIIYSPVTGLETVFSPASNSTTRYRVDISNINFLRVNQTSVNASGHRVYAVLSQAPFVARTMASIPNTTSIASVGVVSQVSQVTSAALSSAQGFTEIGPFGTSGPFSNAPFTFLNPLGVSYTVDIAVTSISGADTEYTVIIQESPDGGTSWRSIYTFEPITTAKGTRTYRSPLLPVTGGRLRLSRTLTGVNPSITRSFARTYTNTSVSFALVTTRLGSFNLLNQGFDFSLHGRVRRIVSTNRTANLYYWQIHNSVTALIEGAIPLAAEVYQLPPNTTLALTAADFGEHGTVFGSNPRLVLSTTFSTYTPLNSVAAGSISIFVESL